MALLSYIPLKPILNKLGLIDEFKSTPPSMGNILIFPSILSDEMADSFSFQFMPEIRITSSSKFVEREAIGTKSTLEYISQKLDTFPLSFIMIDDYHIDKMPFDDVDLTRFITAMTGLNKPLPNRNKPPELIISWDSFTFRGYAKKVTITFLKNYENNKPKIVNFDISLIGDFI